MIFTQVLNLVRNKSIIVLLCLCFDKFSNVIEWHVERCINPINWPGTIASRRLSPLSLSYSTEPVIFHQIWSVPGPAPLEIYPGRPDSGCYRLPEDESVFPGVSGPVPYPHHVSDQYKQNSYTAAEIITFVTISLYKRIKIVTLLRLFFPFTIHVNINIRITISGFTIFWGRGVHYVVEK